MIMKNTPLSLNKLYDEEIDYIDEDNILEIIDIDTEDRSGIDENQIDESEMEMENVVESTSGMENENKEDIPASHTFYNEQLGSLYCGSLNKNGELMALGSGKDKGCVWNTVTNDVIILTNHNDSVIFAEFNHNDTYVAIGDMRGTVELWRVNDRTRITRYNIATDVIWMKWHHSADVIIIGTETGEIYVWKVPNGPFKVLPGYGTRAEDCIILPDGIRLAVGYEDGTIRVLNLKENTVLCTISSYELGHRSVITSIDCYMDNNLLISTSVDGKTILSTANNGKVVCILQDLGIGSSSSNESSSSSRSSSTSLSNTNEQNDSEINDSNWIETAAFCKDPAFPVAATGAINGEVFIWDICRQVLRHEVNLSVNGISKIMWKGRSSMLFVATLAGILKCVDARAGTCVMSYNKYSSQILDLYISGDEKKVLITTDDGTAKIFDI